MILWRYECADCGDMTCVREEHPDEACESCGCEQWDRIERSPPRRVPAWVHSNVSFFAAMSAYLLALSVLYAIEGKPITTEIIMGCILVNFTVAFGLTIGAHLWVWWGRRRDRNAAAR